ncbi:alpha/beta hydrolase [Candidatus Thorarchaeota archaeon]|nr:MAG: alpha/beta hydrolase [Candidatus Thorarchaeota archaeon]
MTELQTKSIETDFGTIVYYSYVNPAQSLVNLYIHGLGDNRKWFLRHFNTYSLDRFSWIVPDLLGHGDSSKSEMIESYTMEQQAKYLVAILERERIEHLSLLAHSMGGAIAIALIELLQNQFSTNVNTRMLFYLEGNLDAGDAFFSSLFAAKAFNQFEQEFDVICKEIRGESQEEHMIEYASAFREAGPFTIWASSRDLAPISVEGSLLDRLQKHCDFDCFFIFGEKNKGRLSSENLVRNEQLPLFFIPKAGHGLHTENPSYFWKFAGDLIQKKSDEVMQEEDV